MISLGLVVFLLFVHFIADFVMQSDRMAKGKSSDLLVLCAHVTVYTWTLMLFTSGWRLYHGTMAYDFQIWHWFQFCTANGGAHFFTDYVTSRITSRLWKAGQVHWFFVVIGVDQFLHYVVLLWLAWRMGL